MDSNSRASRQDLLRQLPGVDELLKQPPVMEALAHIPRKLVLESIRETVDGVRRHILAEEPPPSISVDIGQLAQEAATLAETKNQFTLRPVVNATGIVVHTNLGRSLLAGESLARLQEVCRTYNNLEYDLAAGRRGSRYVHAEAVLREITGAEAALVVNNNAAAVFLVLNTLAKDREVIVSRGQLVEIGGSFRIPDVMAASGAILREVGCTNRTHLRDYEQAITEQTALLMKVHCSNYRVIGFTAEVSMEEMARLAHSRGLLAVEDLGSGSLVDVSPFGLPEEPTAQQALKAGADVVTFSGDKLLGGPQAGIILGRRDAIERCKKNPLTRALRVDKMTLAALEATLRLYRDERRAFSAIPTLRMIATPLEELHQRAQDLAQAISACDLDQRLTIRVEENFSQVGGGSLPERNLPTYVVSVQSSHWSAARMEQRLRSHTPPVIGRIEADRFLMDVRTLQPGDSEILRDAFQALLSTTEQ
ncbi:L-seryl-tRNA(Sec) selenium transferase [Desulfacinum hydrothermale DSM 13146]|uniref:L-seryl-tRNA(Sec) selenium transferase n=1 Tax=Desulfacinum hydrothermale DSM 13146 TaxID=1121390 RepID=A0A1W1WXK9_9BACT|nr:L-seryl-tRNA(Sec) selenium transferase [Desulfacinum hydrothermale]SMC16333.1 L-seryl-tRNA(Sec) selenium transferase [Desulfacinum hydrothermale DSM 13146]